VVAQDLAGGLKFAVVFYKRACLALAGSISNITGEVITQTCVCVCVCVCVCACVPEGRQEDVSSI
jgi:hypothetical protein